MESSNVYHAPPLPAYDGADASNQPQMWWQPSSASVSCRVPAEGLDAFLTELRAVLGPSSCGGDARRCRIVSESINIRDAGAEFVDATARARVETASLAQMEAVLAGAHAVSDILAVRREMGAITSRLEAARGTAAYLSRRAAMSTVAVHVSETPRAPPPPPPPRPSWSISGSALRAAAALALVAQHCADVAIFGAVFALPALLLLLAAGAVLRAALACLPIADWRAALGARLSPAADDGRGASGAAAAHGE